MGQLQKAVSDRNYQLASEIARKHMYHVPALVRAWVREDGTFSIQSIPVLQVGGTMLALAGDENALDEMLRIAKCRPELEGWVPLVEDHQEVRRLFAKILSAVERNPGCLQRDVKTLVGTDEGHKIATLIAWLEKAGKIRREKMGRSYALWLPHTDGAPMPPPKRKVSSHRTNQSAPKPTLVDLSGIPHIQLPPAPQRWKEEERRTGQSALAAPSEAFEVRDASAWSILSVQKIAMEERPDTAFRRLHPMSSGLLVIDDIGNAEGMDGAPAAALRYGRTGKVEAKRPLLHDVYRIGVNPMGRGFVALSKESVLHAYDDALLPILETSLGDTPELVAIRERFEATDRDLHRHIRTVALSPIADRYLFTAADEAWCISLEGNSLWGVRLPPDTGGSSVTSELRLLRTSGAVADALAMMGLSYPFSPKDVKVAYRQLAKKWHPDVNRTDPAATRRFQDLSNAMELLTGAKGGSLGAAEDSATVTMSFGRGYDERADWVYASSFSGCANSAFIVGYSGRVVHVSDRGEPVRAYEIGAVPERIVDTGDYLYILTATRLYVLKDEVLHGLIDTYEGGDLISGQRGFGLLEPKRFRWFHEDGTYVGSVVTKAPIRRVYWTEQGLTVETRTQRAAIAGAHSWWE